METLTQQTKPEDWNESDEKILEYLRNGDIYGALDSGDGRVIFVLENSTPEETGIADHAELVEWIGTSQ